MNMPKKLPKAFILFLVFFFLTEIIFLYIGPLMSANPLHNYVKTQIDIARTINLNKDLLVFGDSSAAYAIDANRLGGHTGFACYNFATVAASTMAGNYCLLNKYLKSNKPPKYIILMNTYNAWHLGCRSWGTVEVLAAHFFKDIMISLPIFEFMDCIHTFVATKLLGFLLSTQQYKHEIRRMIEQPQTFFRDLPSRVYRTVNLKQEILKYNGNPRRYLEEINRQKQLSIQQVDSNDGLIMADILSHQEFIRENKFSISVLNKYYLNRFLGKTKEKGIKVFICLSPMLKEFYDKTLDNEYLSAYKSFIKGLAYSQNNTILLTDDFYIVSYEELADAIDHLNKKGSLIFTEVIAEKILRLMLGDVPSRHSGTPSQAG